MCVVVKVKCCNFLEVVSKNGFKFFGMSIVNEWGLCPILLDLGEDVNDLTAVLQRK